MEEQKISEEKTGEEKTLKPIMKLLIPKEQVPMHLIMSNSGMKASKILST